MTTTPTARDTVQPEQDAEQALAARLATDLRALAAVAVAHPEIAELLAQTVGRLYVVLPYNGDLLPDQVVTAVVEQGATEVGPTFADRVFPGRVTQLPGGAIQLATVWLDATAIAEPAAAR
jgi:hypothetical protein